MLFFFLFFLVQMFVLCEEGPSFLLFDPALVAEILFLKAHCLMRVCEIALQNIEVNLLFYVRVFCVCLLQQWITSMNWLFSKQYVSNP